MGKSTICSMIPEAFIIDLGNEYDYLEGNKKNISSYQELKALGKELTEGGEAQGKVIVIDNLTSLLDIIKPYALELYKQTPQGMTDNVTKCIMHLPFGQGYGFLKIAMMNTVNAFRRITKSLILVGHMAEKDGMLGIYGDLDLPSSIKNTLMREADSIGFVSRESNHTILDFNGTRVVSQSRLPHLRGERIVIAESNKEKKVTCFWNRIYQ